MTKEAPEDGYAHYTDGQLELNGYFYEGKGLIWTDGQYAAIFAAKDLTLNCGDHGVEANQGVSAADAKIVITAPNDDGISSYGDVTLEDCTLTVDAGKKGITTESDISISGGTADLLSDGIPLDGVSVTAAGGVTLSCSPMIMAFAAYNEVGKMTDVCVIGAAANTVQIEPDDGLIKFFVVDSGFAPLTHAK